MFFFIIIKIILSDKEYCHKKNTIDTSFNNMFNWKSSYLFDSKPCDGMYFNSENIFLKVNLVIYFCQKVSKTSIE